MMKSICRICVLGAILSFTMPVVSIAQEYPSKPIRLIVPYPPSNGAAEFSARLLATAMSAKLNQPVIVENRSGANGFIGAEAVARSAPDGYTLLFTTSSTFATSVYLAKNLPFDPVKDFSPISLVASPVTVLAVHPSVSANNLSELIEFAKRNPGKLTYGSIGIGSMQHLTGEALKVVAGIDMVHVPYKGSGPVMNDLVAGRLDVYFPGNVNVAPHIKAGKLKVLAVMQLRRYSGMPNVPTAAETIPGFEKAASWFAIVGPANMPPQLVQRLSSETVRVLNQSDVRAKLEAVGIEPLGSTPDELLSVLKKDIERSGALMKNLGIQPE